MHALPLSFRVVLLHAKHRRQRAAKEAAAAAAGAKQPRKQIGQWTDFTVNCLTAANHFCGSLSARGLLVAARLLAPRRSKERRFLRACQVRKSVRAGPLVNLERDRQSHSTTQPSSPSSKPQHVSHVYRPRKKGERACPYRGMLSQKARLFRHSRILHQL